MKARAIYFVQPCKDKKRDEKSPEDWSPINKEYILVGVNSYNSTLIN